MKIGGQPKSDKGLYTLTRGAVLEVLTRNYVVVEKYNDADNYYKLTKDDISISFVLPPIIPAKIVFRLANYFLIQSEEFYTSNPDLH